MGVLKKDVQVGPWGSSTGGLYKFKPDGKITKIDIGHGSCIDYIIFYYICSCDETEKRSEKYGGNGGAKHDFMTIAEDEEIVELSGTLGSYNGYMVITSLCFKTNKKTCNFGSRVTQDKFSLPVNTNSTKFVGFHGRYGQYLSSIGAFLEPK